ncbi:hypothetical protein ABK046_42820, partial [Streptomyces caeruleatus]
SSTAASPAPASGANQHDDITHSRSVLQPRLTRRLAPPTAFWEGITPGTTGVGIGLRPPRWSFRPKDRGQPHRACVHAVQRDDPIHHAQVLYLTAPEALGQATSAS